jgi:hypothetical protein
MPIRSRGETIRTNPTFFATLVQILRLRVHIPDTENRTAMKSNVALASVLALLAPSAGVAQAQKKSTAATTFRAITASPASLRITNRYEDARILVYGVGGAQPMEIGGAADFRSTNPSVVQVDENGYVRALKDGKAEVIAASRGLSVRVPVTVVGTAKSVPRFTADVIPVLTRTGCSMGSCHGAAQGKGGFRLSLQGFDPDFDHESIVRGAAGRRISRSWPEASLLLRKPTLAAAHKGGLRMKEGSYEYRVLRDWVAAGMPGPDPKEKRVVKLTVVPTVRTLAPQQKQRFNVRAVYSDGSVRDVTSQTLFTASDEQTAAVTANGEATAKGPGEGAVLARYQGLVAVAHVVSPFSKPRAATLQSSAPKPGAPPAESARYIDALVERKLAALGLPVSPKAGDTDFLRRVTLDLLGVLPTPEEVRAFLSDTRPDKRARLVEDLLARPEYVDFWTLRWGDLLRSSRRTLGDKGMWAFNQWIRESVASNKPWDQFVREVLTAQGSTLHPTPAAFFRTATKPDELAETTAQAFLGVRIQCAKCHNHPYERWTLNQYYQMAAFFPQVRGAKGDANGEFLITVARGGEVNHPKTGQRVQPTALDAKPVPDDFRGDRRTQLADWVTSPQNPFFSRILVNRLWRHFLGRGLVEPVDDMRATNPPSNEPLLDFLAADFSSNGFDIRRTIRSILLSETYQRTAIPLPGNARDTKYLSHYAFKRLSAEQLLDAIGSATGVPDKFAGMPSGFRATQLPDSSSAGYFLDLFGKPARNITCECERSDEPSLGQVLHLMNNAGLNGKISDKSGRLARLLEAKTPDAQLVEELYLATVSRLPNPKELASAVGLLAKAKDRKITAEDLMWSLMNSTEFVFNH